MAPALVFALGFVLGALVVVLVLAGWITAAARQLRDARQEVTR